MRPVDKVFKVTQNYGNKSKLYPSKFHKGVDYGCPIGTPVYACVAGVVTTDNWGRSFGSHIIIDNAKFSDGSAGLWMGYMHLSKIKVVAGQKVKAGQIIGWSGNTGHTTGPHLHIEVQKKARWNALNSVNPEKWITA
jgi:murein DD-endopeptidase MepM/ murein hydrolase activator NlpD